MIARGGAGGTVANPLVAQPTTALRSRQVLTSVVVWDGQTVVLGGMIFEDVAKHKDKVPVLGIFPLSGGCSTVNPTLLRKESGDLCDPNDHRSAGNPIAASNLPTIRWLQKRVEVGIHSRNSTCGVLFGGPRHRQKTNCEANSCGLVRLGAVG